MPGGEPVEHRDLAWRLLRDHDVEQRAPPVPDDVDCRTDRRNVRQQRRIDPGTAERAVEGVPDGTLGVGTGIPEPACRSRLALRRTLRPRRSPSRSRVDPSRAGVDGGTADGRAQPSESGDDGLPLGSSRYTTLGARCLQHHPAGVVAHAVTPRGHAAGVSAGSCSTTTQTTAGRVAHPPPSTSASVDPQLHQACHPGV
jgi:hypothetical protein